MSMTLYGIPNCDTVRKARGWLEGLGLDYTFHDYKKAGIEPAKLREWVDARGWEAILNRQGPTFRKLDEADKAGLDADRAIEVMCAHTSTIKRPVLEYANENDSGLLIGFDEQAWSTALAGELT